MAYKALYREYRPQTFEEVVGQQQIVQTLRNSIKEGRVAHAYLFTGPRGTGKTTIAKLIAKALNCSDSDKKPCGHCKNCIDIANGTYPDVIEIDAASNNSVDDAREIIEQVKYSPVEGKYKIYIIDEVHMLTSGAFNALLKTLEEPPAHVIFILATTEVHKVLPTIISRCQRFDFGRISNTDLMRKVEEILRKEGIDYEHEVPGLIARLADGGVRDAIGILDQSISYSGKNLTCKAVREIYGVLSSEEACDFIKTFNSEDIIGCLTKIDEFDKRGIDIIRLTNHLVDIFKDLVIYNKTKSMQNLSVLTEECAKDLANIIDSNTAFRFIDILMEASMTYKRINSPKSYFELAVLKLCNCEKCKDIVTREVIVEKVVEQVKEVEPVEEEVKQPIVEEIVKEGPVVQEIQPTLFDQEPEVVVEPIKEAEISPDPIVEQKVIEQAEPIVEETIEPVVEEPKIEEKSPIIDTVPMENSTTVSKMEINPATPITDSFAIKRIILNYMVNGSKEKRTELDHMWNAISKYIYMPKYAKAANCLRDGSIAVATNNAILIQMDTEQEANVARSPEMYYECKALINELYHQDFIFFTVSGEQFKSAKVSYVQLRDSGKLPAGTEIKDIYTKEECEAYINAKEAPKKESDEEILGKELFGDLFQG